MITCKVEQGEILVNSVFVIHNTDDMIMVEVDLQSKYPELLATSDNAIYLQASEHTLYKGKEGATMIEFDLPNNFAFCGHRLGRYHVDLMFYNRNKQRDDLMIWNNQENV